MDFAKEIQDLEKKHESLREELSKRQAQKAILDSKLEEVLAEIEALGIKPDGISAARLNLEKELTNSIKELSKNYEDIKADLDALEVEK